MILFDQALLNEYLTDDPILKSRKANTQPIDLSFTSHRWLLESTPKRMIYHYMYGDLLKPSKASRRILDVGGGYCALSRPMLKYHQYTLLDIMAHDDHEAIRTVENSVGRCFWENTDWYHFDAERTYDLVIANDLFPNVDQRLALFLERFLPRGTELRLSLTYYNTPRFYTVKRMDGDEILQMLAWDGLQVKRVLEGYISDIMDPRLDLLLCDPPSLFANKRQVCLVSICDKKGRLP